MDRPFSARTHACMRAYIFSRTVFSINASVWLQFWSPWYSKYTQGNPILEADSSPPVLFLAPSTAVNLLSRASRSASKQQATVSILLLPSRGRRIHAAGTQAALPFFLCRGIYTVSYPTMSQTGGGYPDRSRKEERGDTSPLCCCSGLSHCRCPSLVIDASIIRLPLPSCCGYLVSYAHVARTLLRSVAHIYIS
jgi:hypothetical protein